MKPFAYISDQGVLFKELPPSPWFNLTPLYMMRELTNEEISDIRDKHLAPKYCDIYTFARAILKAAACEETKPYESDFVKNAKLKLQAGEE
jgi:hypothetical protein